MQPQLLSAESVDHRGQVIRNKDLLELLQVRLGVGDYLFKHHSNQAVDVVWKKMFNVNMYIMSPLHVTNNLICRSYIAVNSLCFSYLQCVGGDFTGNPVFPLFLAVRPAFSLKCIAARYSL